jgi:hypothetical protein
LNYFFSGKNYAPILTKYGFGFILGDLFRKLIWSPWLKRYATLHEKYDLAI